MVRHVELEQVQRVVDALWKFQLERQPVKRTDAAPRVATRLVRKLVVRPAPGHRTALIDLDRRREARLDLLLGARNALPYLRVHSKSLFGGLVEVW